MKTFMNINNLNEQIQQYVRQIKNKKVDKENSDYVIENKAVFSYQINDIRSNLSTLDGRNKFNIQNMVNDEQHSTSSEYATEAYEHLQKDNENNKIIIDFMHKNNRKFDVKA